MLNYISTLNLIKMNIKYKKKQFFIKYNRKNLYLLNKLVVINIIYG